MSRARLSLNGSWNFIPDPQSSYQHDTLPATNHTIQVPGAWEHLFNGEERFGRAWYVREVDVPADWRERALYLRFGAVNYYTQVWINGQYVGEHEGGYTPFSWRVDHLVKWGEPNRLVVMVLDPAYSITAYPALTLEQLGATLHETFGYQIGEIPLGKQNWYGSVSGIWQDVYLESAYATTVTGAMVLPDIDHCFARVKVGIAGMEEAGQDLTLRLQILDAEGQIVDDEAGIPLARAIGDSAMPDRPHLSPRIDLRVDGVRLWQLEDPYLYHVRATLERNGEVCDEYTSRFGMRKVAIRDNRILLNDHPIYIIGALDQDFYPETGYTPPSKEFLEEQVDKAKHMGLNLLRCHIKAPDPAYLDVADEKGILVWEELPNWISLTEKAAQRGRETITRMIERDYNHPSVIIWTIINESWGADLAGREDDRKWLRGMYDYVKDLDPTRLVVDNSPCNMPGGRNFHIRTDIEDYHIYFQIPDHYQKWAQWVKDFSRHPSWTFSFHGDAERTGEEPLMVSEFGNWGLPTLRDLITEYGQEPTWFRTGQDQTQPSGVLRRFTRFHLDEIFGSYDQFAIATQWQQYFSLKYQICDMRRYPSIVGYVITEFTDLHWEANGLMNIWRRPKVFYNHLAKFQQQDVIIADWENINFWSGDLCQVDVVVSHFSREDLTDCTVEWNVSELGENGRIEHVNVPPYQSPQVGTVKFVVPPIDNPVRCRLHLRLRDRNARIVARNTQYVSFFPTRCYQSNPTTEPIWVYDPHAIYEMGRKLFEAGYNVVAEPTGPHGPARFAVATRLDRNVKEFIENGGNVLLLIRSPEDVSSDLDEFELLKVRDRRVRVDQNTREKNPWEGDWVSNFTWVKHQPIFRDIPRVIDSPLQGELMDFQYYRVTPNQVMLGWDQNRDFEDILAGMVVGWVHSPVAVLAQCKWGKGKLLASTMRLQSPFGEEPVATIILRNLIAYMLSSRFQPKKDIHQRFTRRQAELAAATEPLPPGTPVPAGAESGAPVAREAAAEAVPPTGTAVEA